MKRVVRVLALVAVVALVAGACGNDNNTSSGGGGTPSGEAVKVGLVYDIGGRGDQSFNDSAARGLDKAKSEFNLDVKELEPNTGGTNRGELLRLVAEQGYGLTVAVGFAFATDVCNAGLQFPNIHFADVDGFIDHTTANCTGAKDLTASSNVTSLLFAEHEGSFLVGVAAALKSQSGHLGFIGGVDVPLIHKFQAGFEAGAKAINPDVTIDVTYLSQPPDFSGFGNPAAGKEAAAGMYQAGADVVYHAAGGSGAGLFTAAKEFATSSGKQVWAIGVDSDQYLTAPADEKPYILTSMLKRVDVAVYETIKDYVEDGKVDGGYRTFDLKAGGIDYSTSNPAINDIKAKIDEYKQKIINGEITVPSE
jgi:basic membrane protein A and related proteins